MKEVLNATNKKEIQATLTLSFWNYDTVMHQKLKIWNSWSANILRLAHFFLCTKEFNSL